MIAGEALGVRAVIETHTPIVYQDWSLDPGADVTLPLAPDHQALAYVFEGAIEVAGQVVREGQMRSSARAMRSACAVRTPQDACCCSRACR